MTAPLKKAIDCCDSEVDGEIAGLPFFVRGHLGCTMFAVFNSSMVKAIEAFFLFLFSLTHCLVRRTFLVFSNMRSFMILAE